MKNSTPILDVHMRCLVALYCLPEGYTSVRFFESFMRERYTVLRELVDARYVSWFVGGDAVYFFVSPWGETLIESSPDYAHLGIRF